MRQPTLLRNSQRDLASQVAIALSLRGQHSAATFKHRQALILLFQSECILQKMIVLSLISLISLVILPIVINRHEQQQKQEGQEQPSAAIYQQVTGDDRGTPSLTQNPDIEAVISWTSTGDSFNIKNISKFTDEILPQYFKHRNFSSFIRQLNMYGFRKTRHPDG